MNKFLHTILDWSELWALLIPLTFLLVYKSRPKYMKPVRIFVCILFFLNVSALLMWKYQDSIPYKWLTSNNFVYNAISILRFCMFSWFFLLLDQPFLRKLKKIIPVIFGVFVLLNFTLFENFMYYWSFSSRLLSIETGLLLLYCLQYYFFVLNDDTYEDRRPPSFWVVTGLSIYVVINFPIFLFYKAFLKQFENFAVGIWDVTNISFILFCLLLAKAFYESRD